VNPEKVIQEGAGGEGSGPAGDPAPGAQDHRDVVTQLFRDHNRALVKFLLTRLTSEQEARDVAQEAYVRLLQLDRPGAISFLRGYLFRLAANLSVDRIRHRVVREKAAVELFDELAEASVTEESAITREEVDLACDALKELPLKQQEAFLLHVVEGYSTPEVARRLRVHERTVRKYVTDALLHCRSRIRSESSGEGT